MNRLPQRISLAAQTAAVLREVIAAGEWARHLPGELELARRFGVSRVTLRAALRELEREQILRAGQGKRREILVKRSSGGVRRPNRRVVFLAPGPLHQLPASTIYWIDRLREHLERSGCTLDFQASGTVYRAKARDALASLVGQVRAGCWVLYRSTPAMQRWFEASGDRAVIAGSPYAGVKLPSIDVDFAASCRHAAGRFVAGGHARVAIVRPDTELAGDLESVAGFEAGMGARVPSVLHDGTARGICAALRRHFGGPVRPTGLLVFHTAHALTVLGWLQKEGIPVPGKVSVVCRDDDAFLDFVVPKLARYATNVSMLARKLSRLIERLMTGDAPRMLRQQLVPDFVSGETLGKVDPKQDRVDN